MAVSSKPFRGGRMTKHLSALDFLLSIPLRSEAAIIERGLQAQEESGEEGPGRVRLDDDDNHSISTTGDLPPTHFADETTPSLVGKKLQGPICEQAKIPTDLRYRVLRMLEQNQTTRLLKWEEQLLRSGETPLLKARIMFSRARYRLYDIAFVTLSKGLP